MLRTNTRVLLFGALILCLLKNPLWYGLEEIQKICSFAINVLKDNVFVSYLLGIFYCIQTFPSESSKKVIKQICKK